MQGAGANEEGPRRVPLIDRASFFSHSRRHPRAGNETSQLYAISERAQPWKSVIHAESSRLSIARRADGTKFCVRCKAARREAPAQRET